MSIHDSIIDVLIIGGGINGAGIAYDAIRRGLSVALYEQHDFGFGASTATSKLAHGGLRYLENYQFKLVKESLNERNFLLKRAPHLVKPLQFYVPLYKDSKWQPWKMRVGLSVYDWLQGKKELPSHEMVNRNKLMNNIPWLKSNGCLGAASYYDAQMDDHRLIIELLLMAQKEGAQINNYHKVVNVESSPWGYSCNVVSENSEIKTINATSVISATGAWSNQFSSVKQVKPSKGTHIVLPDMSLNVALLLMSPRDNRVFFMMPWYGKTLVGTTDQYGAFDYDHPTVSNEEIDYLLSSINAYHTKRDWTKSDIIDSFCGFRPLIHTDITQASNQTREDAYTWVKKNMLMVTGGKYTTYRLMAERAVNILQKKVFQNRRLMSSVTETCDFMGKLMVQDWPSSSQLNQLSNRYHLHRETLINLIDVYGNLYKEILNVIEYEPELGAKIDIEYPIIAAEMKYCIVKEWVKTFADFMTRRNYYGYLHNKDIEFIQKAAHQFKLLSSSEETEDEMVRSILREFI